MNQMHQMKSHFWKVPTLSDDYKGPCHLAFAFASALIPLIFADIFHCQVCLVQKQWKPNALQTQKQTQTLGVHGPLVINETQFYLPANIKLPLGKTTKNSCTILKYMYMCVTLDQFLIYTICYGNRQFDIHQRHKTRSTNAT